MRQSCECLNKFSKKIWKFWDIKIWENLTKLNIFTIDSHFWLRRGLFTILYKFSEVLLEGKLSLFPLAMPLVLINIYFSWIYSVLNYTNCNQIWLYIPEIFIEISILIQVLEYSNMNYVCPGEIFSHPTPMNRPLLRIQQLFNVIT